jgi:uncharacterized membrane protein
MPGQAPPRWDAGRVEAFSDGVFAIAITLLVLEIKVDPSDFDHLAHALTQQWPAYLAYVTSYLAVAVRGVLVIGGEGRLSLRWLKSR